MNLMSTEMFWATIDNAWAHAEGRWEGMIKRNFREAIANGDRTVLREAVRAFIASLDREFRLHFTKADVAAFSETFRTKVFALNTDALVERLSDAPLRYVNARHFIVALGREHFEHALTNPESAVDGGTGPRIDAALQSLYLERTGRAYPRG